MTAAALVVIDMQEDFFRQPAIVALRPALVASTNELSRAFRARGLPVIWVVSEFAADLSDSLLEARRRGIGVAIAGTPGAAILRELVREPSDAIVIKKRYSAFFETDLAALLGRDPPGVLVMSGVNTHACVRTSVIDAYQRDHQVVMAGEAVGSYDEEHDRVTRRYFDDKIAAILGNREILRRLDAGTLVPWP
jgi:nicotinamidase-related amidase